MRWYLVAWDCGRGNWRTFRVDRLGHPSPAHALDAERCEYRTADDSLDWLAIRVGMLGVDLEVHEPPELVERFRELAGRFARASAGA